MLFATAFFSVCTVALGLAASRNNRGMLIGGVIELGPTGATVFYWVLFTFGVLSVICLVALGYQRLRYRRRIVLGHQSIIVPANGWSAAEKQIDFRDIQTLTAFRLPMFAGRVLNITYIGGRCNILQTRCVQSGV